MATKPILFSTPMVQAILEGRKSMTRRTISANNSLVDGSGISAVPFGTQLTGNAIRIHGYGFTVLKGLTKLLKYKP